MTPIADVTVKEFLTKIELHRRTIGKSCKDMHEYCKSLLKADIKSEDVCIEAVNKLCYILPRCQACSVAELYRLDLDLLKAVAKTIRFTDLVDMCEAGYTADLVCWPERLKTKAFLHPLYKDTRNPDLLSSYDKAKYWLLFAARFGVGYGALCINVWRMGSAYRHKGFKAMHRVLRKLGNPFKKGR